MHQCISFSNDRILLKDNHPAIKYKSIYDFFTVSTVWWYNFFIKKASWYIISRKGVMICHLLNMYHYTMYRKGVMYLIFIIMQCIKKVSWYIMYWKCIVTHHVLESYYYAIYQKRHRDIPSFRIIFWCNLLERYCDT